MNSLYPFCSDIELHVKGRISADDAQRQEKTAREILKRLTARPGIILADEVGMGKTFVALAVAISAALSNRGKHPVVVMVPSALKEKWPADLSLFLEKCLPPDLAKQIRFGRAERAVEFLKLIDDPPARRKSVIFLTHGALRRGLNDYWVMLALIRQSIHRRKGIDHLRNALYRNMGDLLQVSWIETHDPNIWRKLLKTDPTRWLSILEPLELEDDDPVPDAVIKALPNLNTENVFEAVSQIPLRRSKNYKHYITKTRRVLKSALRSLWKECLPQTKMRLPLLILDEAHHLKNADTKLASLFRTADSKNAADEISRGPLAGVFERMLFLTATPFQLGHGELCSVLDRFDGICWTGKSVPSIGQNGFEQEKKQLRSSLDVAQETAITLDKTWGRLCAQDLKINGVTYDDSASWWEALNVSDELTPPAVDVLQCYENTKLKMNDAQQHLSKWVVRHLKPRHLPGDHSDVFRRQRLVGSAIESGQPKNGEQGILVQGESLLPFLLAARATSHHPDSRPVFAEGLSSSYEAFLHTRSNRRKSATDGDDDEIQKVKANTAVRWYLNEFSSLLPKTGEKDIHHPKIAATVQRVVDIWRGGEKAVVFCHYVATGRVLRQRISDAIHDEIMQLGAKQMGIPTGDVGKQLDLLGKRFFDDDSPIRRTCDQEALKLVSQFPALNEHTEELCQIIRRNVRTPSFLVRYFPLDRKQRDEEAIRLAFDTTDASGLSLRDVLSQFLHFLVERCGQADRQRYINAVKSIQTGVHFGADAAKAYSEDELQGTRPDQLLPNVRLVNGATKSDTRQRIMLTFNTPFYPEILIASSVMAEGVDLHLNCRHIIHHDLCWNPSTLEQRTGRVDRIGSKAETVGEPIQVYLPFIAETQDEKMYRVVMDRERWFNVVMGEDYKVDARSTDRIADRIPFPANAANELSLQLGIDQN